MPVQQLSEERYPLLLLFVEDGKGGSKRNSRIAIDKERSAGITSGATAVITQWPSKFTSFKWVIFPLIRMILDHVTSCWVTSIFCGLTLFILTMLLLAATSQHRIHTLKPRCIGSHIYNDHRMDNTTIHLIHHAADTWSSSELNTLDDIAQNYPQCKIHLVIINNERERSNFIHKLPTVTAKSVTDSSSNATTSKLLVDKSVQNKRKKRSKRSKKTQRKKRKMDKVVTQPEDLELNINVGPQNLFNLLLNRKRFEHLNSTTPIATETSLITSPNPMSNIDELLEKYPQIFTEHVTYNEVFRNSPLFFSWRRLNKRSRLFAIRVLYLWQYAGISFDLPHHHEQNLTNNAYKTINATSERVEISISNHQSPEVELANLVALGYADFKKLPEGVVSIDEEGLHMETKTSCHAFFGELLMELRKSNEKGSPASMIKKTIVVFCKKRAVDPRYCANIKD